MNLTEIPTPRCDGIRFQSQTGMMPPFDTVPYTVGAQIEREAAALLAICNMYRATSEIEVKTDPRKLEMRLFEADRAFDALKEQLNETKP